MDKRQWSSKVLLRYFLLQLPGFFFILALLIFFHLIKVISIDVIWIVLVVWIIKDIVLYPFVWKVYDKSATQPKNSMLNQHGVVTEHLNPWGYVMVNGESWQARLEDEKKVLKKGESVYVTDIEGLTLIVRQLKPEKKFD
jgi:membrane protein implicated in regulation of membrane protease activity